MAPQKRKLPSAEIYDMIKATETSIGPRAVKKFKIRLVQSVENEDSSSSLDSPEDGCNDNLVLNCSDHLEHIYSHLAIDATIYGDEAENSNNNKFKKNCIVEKNVNNHEELNLSTENNDVASDLPSSSNDYVEHLPMYRCGQDESMTSDEDEDNDECEQIYSDETLSSDEDEENDECEQIDSHVSLSSDEDEENVECDDIYIGCVQDDPLTPLKDNNEECSFISEHQKDVSDNLHDHQIKNNVLEAQNNKNADVVIDLLDDSSDSDEEVFKERDFINLSLIKYCDYRCEPEYLKNVFPEFCLKMLLDLQSRFHKVKKSDQVLSYSGRRVGLTCDCIERVFIRNLWFNGDTINCYLKLLCRGREETHFSFDSYLLNDFRSRGYESTEWRTVGVDIFSKKVLFLPVHLANSHWALLYVNVQEHDLYYVDSLSDYEVEGEKQMNIFIEYLNMEHQMKKKTTMKSCWRNLVVDISPIQYNNIDCGAFVCLNAKDLIRDKFPDFEQEDIPLLRVKIIHEILTDQMIN